MRQPSTSSRHAGSIGRVWPIALRVMLAGIMLALAGCATTGASTLQVEHLVATHYDPTQVVDVLDVAPSVPFENIARLRVDDPTGTATRSQLVAELVAAAQKLGANAVVVGAEQRSGGSDVGFNPSGGQIQNVNGTGHVTLTAMAIRYTH